MKWSELPSSAKVAIILGGSFLLAALFASLLQPTSEQIVVHEPIKEKENIQATPPKEISPDVQTIGSFLGTNLTYMVMLGITLMTTLLFVHFIYRI